MTSYRVVISSVLPFSFLACPCVSILCMCGYPLRASLYLLSPCTLVSYNPSLLLISCLQYHDSTSRFPFEKCDCIRN